MLNISFVFSLDSIGCSTFPVHTYILTPVGLAAEALRLNAVLFITFGFQMVYASLYLAIGKSLVGSVLSLGRQGIFFFPLVFVLPHFMGLTGVVWVQPMADLLTAILTIVFAVRINHALSTEIEMGED